jgi:hypothetical protein
MTCPICDRPEGEAHVPDCAMECYLCRPPVGKGHMDFCRLPSDPPVIKFTWEGNISCSWPNNWREHILQDGTIIRDCRKAHGDKYVSPKPILTQGN